MGHSLVHLARHRRRNLLDPRVAVHERVLGTVEDQLRQCPHLMGESRVGRRKGKRKGFKRGGPHSRLAGLAGYIGVMEASTIAFRKKRGGRRGVARAPAEQIVCQTRGRGVSARERTTRTVFWGSAGTFHVLFLFFVSAVLSRSSRIHPHNVRAYTQTLRPSYIVTVIRTSAFWGSKKLPLYIGGDSTKYACLLTSSLSFSFYFLI